MRTTDVLIICALKDELDALLDVRAGVSMGWTEVENEPPYFSATLVGDAGEIQVAAARATQMGIGAATDLAKELGAQLDPGCYAMCGVCAGHPDDTDLGDVIIADRVFEYNNGKLTTDGLKGDLRTYVLDERWARAAQDLVGPTKQLHGYAQPNEDAAKWWLLERLHAKRHPKKSAFARYFPAPRQATMLESLLEQELVSLRGETFELTERGREMVTRHRAIRSIPAIALPYHTHVGPIGSGSYVVADGDTWEAVAGRGMRKILGLEMEAVAIGAVAHRQGRPFVVAKGVMDHGDPEKRDQFKAFAARASAEVLCALLRRVVTARELQAEKTNLSANFEGPKPDACFIGRDDELAALARLLLANRTVCVIATGIGGIGKTTLVSEFVATTARKMYPDGIAWLDGSPGQLTTELARVSRRFGWSGQLEPTPDESIDLLNANLAGKRVLLVVDGFDPERTPVNHVPLLSGESRTLVTSRTRTLDVDLNADAVRLELGVWPVEVCRNYLRKRCEWLMNAPDADVDALAEFVGRLPLGVKLLVSVLRHRRGTSVVEMLRLLRAQPLGMLDKYAGDRGVAATFRMGFDNLPERERRVLQALAVCARQTRVEVVGAVGPGPSSHRRRRMRPLADTGEALDELHARGFAELDHDGLWGLHDVVRMFVLEQPGREDYDVAHTAWVRAHLERHAEATAWKRFSDGVDEARHAFERLLSVDLDGAAAIYGPLEGHLAITGRLPEAMALSERFLEVAPVDSTFAAIAMDKLGLCHRRQGDLAKAIDLHERALDINMKLGDFVGFAHVTGNLALCFEVQDDLVKAIELFECSLGTCQHIGDFSAQASSLGNLGNCYQKRGDIAKAIEFHEQSLYLSAQHGCLESLASALGNLGYCYQQQGDIVKAIEFHKRSLEIEEGLGRLEGQATSLGQLGYCHQKQGDIAKAIEAHEQALLIGEKLGRIDVQAQALHNLGDLYPRQGEIPKAIELFERSYVMTMQSGIAEGQASALRGLGICYEMQGDIPKAIELFEHCLSIVASVGDTKGQAVALSSLGICHRSQGDIAKGIQFHKRALYLYNELHDLEGEAGELSNLGACYQIQGEISEATDLLERSLALSEQLGYLEAQAATLGNLGLIATKYGTPEQARDYLSRSLELFRRIGFSDRHPNVANLLNVIADIDQAST